MLDNIPNELRLLTQWVSAGPDKEPMNPRTGARASVTDPSTWGTFLEARQAGLRHVGFVLSKEDPYAIIDLDNPFVRKVHGVTSDITPTCPDYPDALATVERHKRILAAFDSYTEVSQSGTGIHIVVRGRVPSGVRRDKVEVYSDTRYMIFTGRVLNNIAITDHQPLLEQIHHEMASTAVTELEEREAIQTDEQLLVMASGAVNAEKFNRLCSGDQSGYPSQSEADFALLTILCFYSKSDSQVRRMFRMSALGKRDKAMRNDDYINRALCKIRGKQAVPLVDISALLNKPLPAPRTPQANLWAGTQPPPPPPVFSVILPPPPPPAPATPLPPGLVGEMANYVHSSAIRPVWEVALAAAIAYSAGLVGRCYNISSTGLNQFVILLATTGTGKEGASGGIDAMQAAVRHSIPAVDDFVGPAVFASGQALTRMLDKNPSFVSVLGEIGLTLQQVCDKRAAAHHVQLRRVLLDIYAKSGWNKWLRPSVYSDTEKNTMLVRAPNVTILGESTPGNFYGALDGSHISEGLVPRFMVLEYSGLRPPANSRAFHPPDSSLVSRLTQVVQTSLTMKNNQTCCPVQCDRWAHGILEAFNQQADDMINNAGEDDVVKQLWNRAHIKALKLAALVAVGCNIHAPTVTKDVAEWAVSLIARDIGNMTIKFSTGVVGEGDHQHENDIRIALDKYPQLTTAQRRDYKVPNLLLDKPTLVPYAYLKRHCTLRASFKNDRRGAVVALKIAIDDMVKSGMLMLIPQDQAHRELGVDSPIYYKGENY